MTTDVNYWCFNEVMLDSALRDWAGDMRHEDVSESACKDRFDLVQGFLYSKQSRAGKLFQGFEISLVKEK